MPLREKESFIPSQIDETLSQYDTAPTTMVDFLGIHEDKHRCLAYLLIPPGKLVNFALDFPNRTKLRL